jgi:hypothetical protein
VEKSGAVVRAALPKKYPSRKEHGQRNSKSCEVRFGNSDEQTPSNFEGRKCATMLIPARLREWRYHSCVCATAMHRSCGKEAKLSSRTIRE